MSNDPINNPGVDPNGSVEQMPKSVILTVFINYASGLSAAAGGPSFFQGSSRSGKSQQAIGEISDGFMWAVSLLEAIKTHYSSELDLFLSGGLTPARSSAIVSKHNLKPEKFDAAGYGISIPNLRGKQLPEVQNVAYDTGDLFEDEASLKKLCDYGYKQGHGVLEMTLEVAPMPSTVTALTVNGQRRDSIIPQIHRVLSIKPGMTAAIELIDSQVAFSQGTRSRAKWALDLAPGANSTRRGAAVPSAASPKGTVDAAQQAMQEAEVTQQALEADELASAL